MDDIQLLVYIALIAFGLFSRFLKVKKGKPPARKAADEAGTPETEKKTGSLTFEELLREFTGETAETKKEEPAPAEPSFEVLEPEYEYDDEIVQRRYQQSLEQAKGYEKKAKPPKDDRHTGQFSHFRGYDEHEWEEEENEFIKILREEDGPKKAIILGEILNRRY